MRYIVKVRYTVQENWRWVRTFDTQEEAQQFVQERYEKGTYANYKIFNQFTNSN